MMNYCAVFNITTSLLKPEVSFWAQESKFAKSTLWQSGRLVIMISNSTLETFTILHTRNGFKTLYHILFSLKYMVSTWWFFLALSIGKDVFLK